MAAPLGALAQARAQVGLALALALLALPALLALLALPALLLQPRGCQTREAAAGRKAP